MRVKYKNPRMKQSEIANQLGFSTSTLQRYRNDINMLSPYRIQPNNTNKQRKKTSNTNSNNDLHRDPDLKRPQMTSNDLTRLQMKMLNLIKTKKIIVKAGSVHDNVEINEHYLDEILHNINPQLELAMQIISTDKLVRKDTVQDLKDFNQQSLTTEAKKGEQLVSMMPAVTKTFNLMGDDIVELSVENESLKNQIEKSL